MANPTLMAAIQEYRFGDWRRANPNDAIDVSGSDLTQYWHGLPKNLAGANFSGCKFPKMLSDFDMSGANLSCCDLVDSHIFECDFRGACMTGIKAQNATFTKCNFDGATLSAPGSGSLVRTGNAIGANACIDGVWVRMEEGQSDLCWARFHLCSMRRCKLNSAVMMSVHLVECDLAEAEANGALMTRCVCHKTNMKSLHAQRAVLSYTQLQGVDLSDSNLDGASLSNVDLSPLVTEYGSNLRFEPVRGLVGIEERRVESTPAVLARANLSGANLCGARLVETDLSGACLNGAHVFGVSAWRLKLEGVRQDNLVASPPDEPSLIVDDVELAQFIYMLGRSEKLRRVIDVVTSKMVLILGRFAGGGIERLYEIRDGLRRVGFVPVIFDFEQPQGRSLTETVRMLWGFSRFVVADLSNAASVPHEIGSVYQGMPSVPLLPFIVGDEWPYSMSKDYRLHDWVLPLLRLKDSEQVAEAIVGRIPEIEAKLQHRLKLQVE